MEAIGRVIDWSAMGLLGASLLNWVPAATALLTLVWVGLRIYVTIRDIIQHEDPRETHKKKPPLD